MENTLLLHILRNPYGWDDNEVRKARLTAADLIEDLERSAWTAGLCNGGVMMIEKLKWNDATKKLPDAGSTVLLWARDPKPFANPGWMTGYLDDGGWHDSETSHVLTEIVTHWADPNGPGA